MVQGNIQKGVIGCGRTGRRPHETQTLKCTGHKAKGKGILNAQGPTPHIYRRVLQIPEPSP
jgi:hypothetical protein